MTPQASDGRLGGAVVARPGNTKAIGRQERITGKSARPARPNGVGVGAEANCADAEVQPTPQNVDHVSDVILCLMNATRTGAGLPPLQEQDQLASASVEHSQDMVDNGYFAHDSQDGRDVVARLKAVAYIPKDGQWVVGENLAWGSGTLATPSALVNAWMNSPPHRENLLAADYRDVGIGLVFGTPRSDVPDGVTVTTDFGMRPSAAAAVSGPSGTSTRARDRSGALAATRLSARRKRALRRCARRHGEAKRRCVRAARRIR
ncbi:MAG TPA: CAP domain-containing protein [Thermoleophilaceae bacterium]|nr:CAP domain-containing protein [Thermoleophilaceae bacterium]